MTAIERDSPAFKDVLTKDYTRHELDKTHLGPVVDLISNKKVGGAEARATDVFGSVYEYFLEQFALAESRKGGEFYTPRSVGWLFVKLLEQYQVRVYGPCCGSSGMFVQPQSSLEPMPAAMATAVRPRGTSLFTARSRTTLHGPWLG